MYKEKIMEEMSENLMKNGAKTGILSGIGMLANSFGSIDEELREIVMMNDETKRCFTILAALCGVYMGYTYECETKYGRGHWDLRNEASSQYCGEHLKEFEQIFEEASGIEIRYAEVVQHQAFLRDCLLLRGRNGYRALAGEMETFAREHHTIQQRMMGIFIRLLNELYPGYGLGQVGFPFI